MNKTPKWYPWHAYTKPLSTDDWLYPAPRSVIESRHKKLNYLTFLTAGMMAIFLFYPIFYTAIPTAIFGFTSMLVFRREYAGKYEYIAQEELDSIENNYSNSVVNMLKTLAKKQGFLLSGQVCAAQIKDYELKQNKTAESWGIARK